MSTKYKFHNPDGAYFVSFAIVNWYNLFTQEVYFNVLIDCVNYLRKHKGMELYAYCFMPNHVHMVFGSKTGEPSNLMRDFKGYTAKQLIEVVKANPNDNRKDLIIGMFKKAGRFKSNIKNYQVWQHESHPIEVYSKKFVRQKVNYIHKNPVVAGLCRFPEDYIYSSARNYAEKQIVMEIDMMDSY